MKDAPEEEYFGETLNLIESAVSISDSKATPEHRVHQAAAYAHSKVDPLDIHISSLYNKAHDDSLAKLPGGDLLRDVFYLANSLAEKLDRVITILTTPKKRGRPVGTKGIKKRKSVKKGKKDATRRPLRKKRL